ncbi:MAG TPA: SGNH/GDSL hydrolase family protein [Gemmatimonadaceae bacterium]|nr:SGNH/GDSL hydrolase family protein [Gemmatimonadaceae bacterium]
MFRLSTIVRTATAVLAVAALAGCDDSPELVNAPPPVNPELFASYVALGNSITAGFQSAGINDSTQRESYAAMFAFQVGTRFAIPALAEPGCPPPIDNFQLQTRLGGGNGSTCFFRTPNSVTQVLNNVAVPGATAADPTSSATSASNQLTLFILGGESQVERALDARPTFASVWIGNNDVLEAAISGLLTPTPGVSRGVTPVNTFTAEYDKTIDALLQGADAAGDPPGAHARSHLQGGVLIGVVDVTNAPILFPAVALFNAQFKAGFDIAAGETTTLLPSCTVTTTSLISFQLAAAIRSGDHPPVIGCEPNSVPNTLVGDIFVLDATEQATLHSTVAAYNAHIEALATEKNFAFVDPNPILIGLRTSGDIPAVPNLASATEPFGAFVSLDGVHPRAPAHQLVAKAMIDAVNTKYGTNIPDTDIPRIVP